MQHYVENGLDVYSIILSDNCSVQTWREESNGSLSLVKLDYFGAGSRYVPIPLYAPSVTNASTSRSTATTATHYDTIRGNATPQHNVSQANITQPSVPQHVVHHKGKHSKGIKRPFEDISSASSVGSSRAADAVEQLENYPGK